MQGTWGGGERENREQKHTVVRRAMAHAWGALVTNRDVPTEDTKVVVESTRKG